MRAAPRPQDARRAHRTAPTGHLAVARVRGGTALRGTAGHPHRAPTPALLYARRRDATVSVIGRSRTALIYRPIHLHIQYCNLYRARWPDSGYTGPVGDRGIL